MFVLLRVESHLQFLQPGVDPKKGKSVKKKMSYRKACVTNVRKNAIPKVPFALNKIHRNKNTLYVVHL